MSLGREIFGRMWNGLARKIRSTEGFWANARTNFSTLRRVLLYSGAVYSAGQIFQLYVIEWGSSTGPSMYPTMTEETPFSLISRLHKRGESMSPGDIVNFASPIFPDVYLGKRIIGMPGDFVVRDPHESPSVGGAPVPGVTDWRSSLSGERVRPQERSEPEMIEVPPGHMWAVGDNMAWSRDSRFFGAVPVSMIRGKLIFHSSRKSAIGGQWTTGSQLTRIPKEEEDNYLNAHKRRQIETPKAAVLEAAADVAKVD